MIPIGLLGLAVFVVLTQVNRLRQAAEWSEHSSEAIIYCANVERIAREHKTAVLRGLLGVDTRDDELSARMRAHDALLLLEHHVFDNEAQLHQVRELDARFRTWLAFTKELSHKPRAPVDNLQDLAQIKLSFDSVITLLNELEREERRLHAVRADEFKAIADLALYGTLPGLLVMLIALGMFHRSQMLRLADDFGEAMAGQEAARADLAEQSWVKEQLVTLVGSTRDEPGASALGAKLLECLTRATGAAVGAFYVWDEVALRWICHATHGTVRRDSASFRAGEGLLGQAGKQTSVTSFNGVEDEFFLVASGTGRGSTKRLVFIPCHHDGQVLAVVELGLFEQPSARVERLIHQCGDSIGIAVSVTLKRLAQRELLLASRRQGEALQAQQEELRVTNEELASHSEALRLAHAQLEERKEELEASNADLVRQRDALSAAREDLARRAWELRQANRYKSEFLASMSHELRTPLNSCLILSRALADNKPGNLTEEQVKFAETIHASGADLLELINAVLDLSKIEAGAVELVYEHVTIGDLLSPVVRIMEPIANERKLQFTVRAVEPSAAIEVDVLRTQQILKNLLSNACKFTATGGVSLSVEARDDELEFKVTDTGIGIAEDQFEAIFEAFRQADGTASRRFGGTGLGLTISRDLANRMGGDVRVKSQLGVGSEFVLALPRHRAKAESQPSVAAVRLSSEEPVAAARDVLLVHRDEERHAEVERVIESWGFGVTRVTSNAEALVQLRERPLVAVVAHGGEARQALEQEARQRRVPLHVIEHAVGQQRFADTLRRPEDPSQQTELRTALRALDELALFLSDVNEAAPAEFPKSKRPSTRPKGGGANLEGRRVLVVEDDVRNVYALTSVLEKEGMRVEIARNGKQALEKLESVSDVELVLMDIMMPEMNGLEATRRIRSSQARWQLVPIIALTAKAMSDDRMACLEAGANDYVTKPIDIDKLLSLLRIWLDRA